MWRGEEGRAMHDMAGQGRAGQGRAGKEQPKARMCHMSVTCHMGGDGHCQG